MTAPPDRDLLQFCPSYEDPAQDYIMTAGWLGCFSWALTQPDIIAAFEKETGRHFRVARTPLDRMIDEACGVNCDDAAWEYLSAFAVWMTENLWGDADECS